MELERKDYAIIILGAILVINIFVVISPHYYIPPPPDLGAVLIYGTMEGPADIDPMDAWDSSSYDVHDQVCEGLFGYYFSDPEMGILPKLAKDFGTWNGSNYTVELRDDVWFHDGTRFDAITAKWNFDRLAYLMRNNLTKTHEIFEYYDVLSESFKHIINHTDIIDDYTLKFVCNIPYGPFEALLCFNGAYMLSPASTPADEIIDTATGDLVGTGPFVYDEYEAGVELRLHAWDYYYLPRTKIDTLIFSVINDAQIRNNALLSGDIDILTHPMPSMHQIFTSDPDIELRNDGLLASFIYLAMNNNYLNSTYRKAISYALNYHYFLEELLSGNATRLTSPIPYNIQYANVSNNVAIYNISKARLIMQSMGFGLGWNTSFPGTDDNLWESATFTAFNYTYNYGNTLRENMFILLYNNLKKIGIHVIEVPHTWGCFVEPWFCDPVTYDPNYREMSLMSWVHDFNDPSNFINSLFNNKTTYPVRNLCFYNGYLAAIEAGRDPYNLWDNVQLLMEEALIEVNKTKRRNYYNRIQQILVEEDMPIAFLSVGYDYNAMKVELNGFSFNPLGRVCFYPCYWEGLYEVV